MSLAAFSTLVIFLLLLALLLLVECSPWAMNSKGHTYGMQERTEKLTRNRLVRKIFKELGFLVLRGICVVRKVHVLTYNELAPIFFCL